MKRIYVASPFSHKNELVEDMRYEEATTIIAHLQEKYKQAFIAPITQSYNFRKWNPNLGTSFKHWKNVDLTFIEGCHEVWVLLMNGWDESIGVQAEIKFAKKLKLPVRYIDTITYKVLTKQQLKQRAITA